MWCYWGFSYRKHFGDRQGFLFLFAHITLVVFPYVWLYLDFLNFWHWWKLFFLISWLRQMFEQHLAFNVGSRKKKRRLSFSLLYMLNCGSMSSHLKFKTISQIKMDYSESDFFESLQCACFYRPLMDATYWNQAYILVFPCSCLYYHRENSLNSIFI